LSEPVVVTGPNNTGTTHTPPQSGQCEDVIIGYNDVVTTYTVPVLVDIPGTNQQYWSTETYTITTRVPVWGKKCPGDPVTDESKIPSQTFGNYAFVENPYDPRPEINALVHLGNDLMALIDGYNPFYDDLVDVTGETIPISSANTSNESPEATSPDIPLSQDEGAPVAGDSSDQAHLPSVQIRMDLKQHHYNVLQQSIPNVDLTAGYTRISREQLFSIYMMTADGSLNVGDRQEILGLLSSGATYFLVEIYDTNNNQVGYIQQY